MTPAPRLSVVIPVYGNWWMTQRALRVLERLRSDEPAFETIVVDNASPDETPAEIAAFAWVRYVRLAHNHNFAGACNAGARLAQAPLVLFLNNDAYPLDGALAPLVAVFAREEVAVAGGALFFEDGATQCAGFVMLPNAHWHYSCRNLPPSLPGATQPRDAPAVSGAAMAVRRQWFLDDGGFDESYVNGFEDVDLCMRARERGRAIAYVPGARFAHYEGASAGRYDREAENERRFYRRWSARLAALPRVARGSVGAVFVRAAPDITPLSRAGLHDLELGLRSFGHPVSRSRPRLIHHLDRRFRNAAELAWFVPATPGRDGVEIERAQSRAALRVRGAAELLVPWLPCAAGERATALCLRGSNDPSCSAIALAGFDAADGAGAAEVVAALDAWVAARRDARVVLIAGDGDDRDLRARLGDRAIAADLLSARGEPTEVAGVLHAGLTDESAFGNVLLAQAEIATIVPAGNAAAALLAPDVVMTVPRDGLVTAIAALRDDPDSRAAYARRGAADARRRFSPRRSAIRVVDLLCAARFGLERSAPARSNTPL